MATDDHEHCGHSHEEQPPSMGRSILMRKASEAGAHSHSHGGHSHASGNIAIAFSLNFVFSLIEFAGGFWLGSLAIMANAIHDFGDSLSLGLAWFLEKLANRKGDERFNFGYRRFSLLSALISGIIITAGSAVILFESIRRLRALGDQAPQGGPMIIFALLGLLANALAAWRLMRGQTQNEKILSWHLIADVAGWAFVLVGGIVISQTGWPWLDPALALLLAVFVIFNVLRYLKETAYLFLQGRPQNFNVDEFLVAAMAVEGVEKVDHVAVWSLDGETSVLSARLHVHNVRDPLEIERVKNGVRMAAMKQKARATLETCLAASAPHGE